MRIFGTDFEDALLDAGFKVPVIRGEECPEEIGCKLGSADYDIDRIYICKK